MNQRERNLALIVGALLLVTAGMFTWDWVSSAFQQRNRALAALDQQIEEKQQIERDGQRAAKRLRTYQTQSLPSNVESARSLYEAWLLNLVTDVDLAAPTVDGVAAPARKDVYTQVAFRIGGKGNLQQVTRFLHQLYCANHLHRIKKMILKPVGDSGQLAVDVQVQALVLPGAADSKELQTTPSQRLALADLASYERTIVRRNPFAPANQPPSLQRIGQREAAQGETFRLRIRADDPDKSGKLTYRLADGAPEGAEIDPATGEFRWTPEKLGTYDVTVEVTDDGLPSGSDTATFAINVVVPNKDSGNEDAEFTYLTAVTDGQRRLAWLLHRPSGRRMKLEEGDSFQAGQLHGKIGKIGSRDAQLVLGDRTLVVAVGQNVNEGRPLPRENL